MPGRAVRPPADGPRPGGAGRPRGIQRVRASPQRGHRTPADPSEPVEYHDHDKGGPMTRLLRPLANEAPLVYALAAAVGAALGLEERWQKVLAAALALLFGLVVRSVTTSPATLADAVTSAATATASQLTDQTVGAAGEMSAAGSNVVVGVVKQVTDAVGGLAGKLAGGTQ